VFAAIFEATPGIERTTCLYIDVLLKRGDLNRAFGAAQRALATLGASDGLLDGALAIQRQLGDGAPRPEAPLLSLCMIVRNEQSHLARCLHSVAPVVDEMVIVDTGSTDRSMDVARVFGATVAAVPWTEDFSAARNAGLALASGKWILIMDADEAISVQDYDTLRQLLVQAPTGSAAFTFATRNYVHEMNALGWQPNDAHYSVEAAGNGWFPSEKVRLFPNLPCIRFSYPVHEVVEPALEAAGIAVQSCPVPIHHYGKIDRNRAAEKGEAYFQIGLQKVEDMAGDPLALRELAVQAMNLERYHDAVSLWQRLAESAPPAAETLVNLSSAHWHCGNYPEARDRARQALDLSPGFKEAAYNLANSLIHLGEPTEAVDVLAPILDRHPDYLAGRFLMAATLCCSDQGVRGASALRSLKETVLGAGLPVSCATLVDSLAAAGQGQSARRLADGAAAAGCGAAKVHELAAQGASHSDAPVLGVVA
jgi:tetratricopeptide (TPR) repeat protein